VIYISRPSASIGYEDIEEDDENEVEDGSTKKQKNINTSSGDGQYESLIDSSEL
jgi:hypothetical protein